MEVEERTLNYSSSVRHEPIHDKTSIQKLDTSPNFDDNDRSKLINIKTNHKFKSKSKRRKSALKLSKICKELKIPK